LILIIIVDDQKWRSVSCLFTRSVLDPILKSPMPSPRMALDRACPRPYKDDHHTALFFHVTTG